MAKKKKFGDARPLRNEEVGHLTSKVFLFQRWFRGGEAVENFSIMGLLQKAIIPVVLSLTASAGVWMERNATAEADREAAHKHAVELLRLQTNELRECRIELRNTDL